MKKETKEAIIFWSIFGVMAVIILGIGIWSLFNVDKW